MRSSREILPDLLRQILDVFSQRRRIGLMPDVASVESVLSSWTQQRRAQFEENQTTSLLFNPLQKMTIKEVDHSTMIGDFLNPLGSHGQGSLFLYAFLRIRGVPNPEKGTWVITVEKGRVDILLKRECPRSVIIIENKANYAIDQPNQMWRYWFREIHNFRLNSFSADSLDETSFQIIFLSPSDSYAYSEQSCQAPEKMPLMDVKPDKVSFAKLVVPWLRDCECKIGEKNHRLKTFISLYCEIWN